MPQSCHTLCQNLKSIRFDHRDLIGISPDIRSTDCLINYHIVFDAILFPASRYVDSIMENGAMAATSIVIHNPLVPNGSGRGSCACRLPPASSMATNGNSKVSTNTDYNNGENAYDENAPRMLDVEAKLACSRGSVTGNEFYHAIPGACRYQESLQEFSQSRT
ncbi:hypothetical protein BU15DRAFT_78404 [Melanogaster broomeanus]|nr:hypothetical protein BU15DRAFT_78404 [Melanogaster broomeanus]